MLRYEICFHPSWWHKNAAIDFSQPFWDVPAVRMDADVVMRRTLFDKFGSWGIGEENPLPRPILGSDNTACGFLFSEILGCKVIYAADNSPQVLCAELDDDAAFALQVPDFDKNPAWQRMQRQLDEMMEKYGHVESHMNLQGVQNLVLDLRGQDIFMDYYDEDSPARHLLDVACGTMLEGGRRLYRYTPNLSAGVTNILKHVRPQNYCTSNCSVEMVSQDIYEEFLLEYDNRLADAFTDFGIHHCGKTMEHVVNGYAKVHNLKFVEVGAFSDLAAVAAALPADMMINARYSPVRLMQASEDEIRAELAEMVRIVPEKRLSISCVGIDRDCPEDKIDMFLQACKELLP